MDIPAQRFEQGCRVIKVGMRAEGAAVYFRRKVSLREIVVRTSVFRSPVRAWQGQTDRRRRKYPKRAGSRVIDTWPGKLSGRFETESRRPKRGQCTTRIMFDTIRAQGYAGSFDRSW
ncbi:hypothetical protein [Burkholderia lata]|uniref:hypothetical protein n=1 Tax=Burkholderia lata (strain ATCC 17760 / DSM 23089 / LMG 22485 / NCIMB 9086 / R18194 / 383) TaxID=482957 RepID=UPI00242AF71E|nr:hypothetical protein [Burkholderia lata]